MNIYEKLLAITNEIKGIEKDMKVGDGKFTYKAISEAQVLAKVKTLEEKYKVYSYPYSRNINYYDKVVSKEGTIKFFMRVETIYRFVNTEKPEEFVDVVSYGDGVDPQDKAPGKAMTYADKYALMKAYKITTGDDPDAEMSAEVKGTPIVGLSPSVIEKANTMGVNLRSVAAYLRTDYDSLTDAQVLHALDLKERQKKEAMIKDEQGI